MRARIQSRVENFDRAAMLAVARRRHPALTAFLRVMTVTGEGRSWGVLVVVLWLGIYLDLVRFPEREFTLFATLSPGIAWIFVKALKVIWRRRRPFQVLNDFPALTYSPLDDSFPSGHTASVFAFLVAMSPLGPLVTGILGVWAAIVSFSRYYLGVHFPSDIFIGALIGVAAGSGMIGIRAAYGADHYSSFVELAKREKVGETYSVEVFDRKAEVLVLAIHGGELERGSSELASAIAGSNWNFYGFRALKRNYSQELHVTSTHYDDPLAIALATRSRYCLSVHGYKDATTENVCLGGANRKLRARVQAELKKTFPTLSLRIECKTIAGTNAKNIVNRCREQGVQLELSQKLRDRLALEPKTVAAFARAIRDATIR